MNASDQDGDEHMRRFKDYQSEKDDNEASPKFNFCGLADHSLQITRMLMRRRIRIEKQSKFPQALSGGGSVGIIQTCPGSLAKPAWPVRSWQVASMQNPANHTYQCSWLFTFHILLFIAQSAKYC